jgi:hypothetical protein
MRAFSHGWTQAIGQRNLAEGERELRRRREREVRALLEERRAHLGRLTAELESLGRVQAAQRDTLERLGNNEPGGV